MQPHLRKLENMHIAFWLMKDVGWVQDLHLLGIVMVIPTLAVAVWLTWKTRRDLSELAHNVAVCCWIIANGIWMIGEFFYNDTTRPLATVFFVLGILPLACFYAWSWLHAYRSPKI